MHAVVIGAGVIGSSIALQLRRLGHDVTVVERNSAAGMGSTSASSAVVRFNYSTFDAVALSWESYFLWKEFKDLIDGANGYAKNPLSNSQEHYAHLEDRGYVMLDVPVLSNDKTMALFDRAGIPYEIWDSEQLKIGMPGIDAGRYWPNKPVKSDEFWDESSEELGAIFSKHGGYVSDPLLAAQNFAMAAKREGVNFRFKKAVVGIEKQDGRVCGVKVKDFDSQSKKALDTGVEVITADVVVNVAGPWSTLINQMAGAGSDFTMELKPLRAEVHQISTPKDILPGPIMGDLDLGTYVRSGAGGITLVGGTEPECDVLEWVEPDKVDEVNMTRTVEVFESQTYRFARRFPAAQIPSTPVGVVGVYDVSSDWTPIYDKTDVPGFYVAIGTSGNQFKNAPGAGLIMAHLITQVEKGADHDSEPVVYQCTKSKSAINLGTFSRKRERNLTSGTVMG
ncbi:sarcosine oxidase, subunit beta [Candidatus Nanopelagicus hibericus]|uniref:Sarcosine oxidase, subunit beta n=1 Tax=Candidatus Nanopelagicus hibericus TaxID=1884915 RepID=A0A249K9Z4_9ACTN|nr:FAD-dependent oxidoreductase [Candidatus Nanopelagicus hibericus]ASY13607.1 sarcosine oxidase, subunit beta [Candidatus Nanopelagicus hibericus]